MISWLSSNGFDVARFRFAFRTALACCLAVVLAQALGLEHPQWAGMSVWAASQPLRGQLIEKSFFRFAGTVTGTIIGILLVFAMEVHPVLLVTGLAFWVSLCTWIGNLQRGLVGYGTVLAGYTASMVSLLDTAHPDQVFHLGADRLATVLTGVVTATVVGYFFAKRTDEGDLRGRVHRLLASLLRHLAEPTYDKGHANRYLSALAAIEEGLDPHAAGSLRSRREVRSIRGVLLAMVPLLLGETREPITRQMAQRLKDAANALDHDDIPVTMRLLEASHASNLQIPLQRLTLALGVWVASPAGSIDVSRIKGPRIVLHRDWIGAGEAGLRAAAAMLLFGAIWLLTGWSVGPYMLLGLSVMISVFSSFENPAITMRHIFAGQLLGVIGAIICRWTVWPHMGGEWQQIMALFPFIMLGPFLAAHRYTFIASTDFNMVLLLMSQPHFPLTGEFNQSVALGLAVLAAPLTAWVGYLLVFPINLQRRQDHLLEIMLRDLAAIAGSSDALSHRQIWQARTYHRVLRLVRISDKLAKAEGKATKKGTSVLRVAQATMRCHEILQTPDAPPSSTRFARLALGRLSRITAQPERAAASLQRLAHRLDKNDASLMLQAANGIADIS